MSTWHDVDIRLSHKCEDVEHCDLGELADKLVSLLVDHTVFEAEVTNERHD